MGGDQCYPQATREEYKKKLLTPYNWAFTVKNPDRKLFALPGNHDWYDGLNSFDSLFCAARDRSSKGNAIGGWQCQQHRSYWAIKLPYNWWIWGADIQFSKYLDASQVSYFETVACADGAAGQSHRLPGGAVLAAGGFRRRGRGGEFLQDHHDRAQARRAHPRRHCRRLAPLRALFRPRARHSLHHVGRRRRLHASDPRPEERHLGALAGAPRRRGEPGARHDRGAPRRGLEAEAVRHPSQTQYEGGRGRRRSGGAGREGRAGAAAEPARSRRQAQAPAAQAAGTQMLSREEQELSAQPRQCAVPVLQSWLRHRPRSALLAHHLGIPDARHPPRHLQRQDRRPRHHALRSARCCPSCRSISSRR